MPISVYILAYNEIDKIEAAVNSVLWADEIVVVDSGSTDGTADRARELGARVVQEPFTGFGAQRNAALKHVTHEWIFSLDSDERCTPEARDEILKIIADPSSPAVWLVPRRNWFFGRWIMHSGWHPDYRQPQLFRRGAMRYTEELVHEGYEVLGGAKVGHMRASIWQVPFRNLAEALHKANRYSSLGAQKLADRGVRGSMTKAVAHGLVAFLRHYVIKLGFLDGRAGFAIACANLHGTFWRYAKLVELQSSSLAPPPTPPVRRAAGQ